MNESVGPFVRQNVAFLQLRKNKTKHWVQISVNRKTKESGEEEQNRMQCCQQDPLMWNFNFIYLIIPVRWKEVTKSSLCSPPLSPTSLSINFSIQIWLIVSWLLCSHIKNNFSPCWTGVCGMLASVYNIWAQWIVHNSGDHVSGPMPAQCVYPSPHSLAAWVTLCSSCFCKRECHVSRFCHCDCVFV